MKKYLLLLLSLMLVTPVYAEASPYSLTVHHIVSGQDVYIDCYVEGVTLSGLGEGKKAKAIVSLDGKVLGSYYQAAFVMKGIPKGHHVFTVEVKERTGKSLQLKEQFHLEVK